MKREEPASSWPSKGPQAFEDFYSAIWGGRWPALRSAMAGPAPQASWSESLSEPYLMDPASVLAALALGRPQAEACLDMCAAPGGKSLVIASRMRDSILVANERSPERMGRLKRVLDRHLPGPLRSSVQVRQGDAARLCRSRPASFGRILLDAPCSSERHVMASERHLSLWSRSRAASLTYSQWALLGSARLLLRLGGRLVYSTCSINPAENQDMAQRLLSRRGSGIQALDARALTRAELEDLPPGLTESLGAVLDAAEDAGPGIMILPDRAGPGAGPMFIAVFEKTLAEEDPSGTFRAEA